MRKLDELHDEAIEHLRLAHLAMTRLMAHSQDWTANVQIRTEFEYLENHCVEFGRHQLGLYYNKR